MMKALRSAICAGVGLIVAGLLVQLSGYSASAAANALFHGATGLMPGPAAGANEVSLGAWHLNLYLLAQSLAKMTPLLFCGLSVMLGLRAGLFNIGGQGQMILGALAAAVVGGLPMSHHTSLQSIACLGAGVAGGVVWGVIPGWLKAKRGVHEALATILMNYLAIDIAAYLVRGPLKDSASMATQTKSIRLESWLTPLAAGSNLTIGILFGILIALLLGLVIQRTSWGFRVRAVGQGPEAARAAGVQVDAINIQVMGLCGGLAGLAGAIGHERACICEVVQAGHDRQS